MGKPNIIFYYTLLLDIKYVVFIITDYNLIFIILSYYASNVYFHHGKIWEEQNMSFSLAFKMSD